MAYLCGIVNFCANMFVYLAVMTANSNNQSVGLVTAISNGNVLIGLFGSLVIFREQITWKQILGSIICFAGVLTLSLSVVGKKKPSQTVVSEGTDPKFIIYEALLAMLFFGFRIVISKYCCRILSSMQFVKLNFIGDCVCGILVIIFASFGMLKIDLASLFLNVDSVLSINFFASFVMIGAEILSFKAVNDGIIGPVVAIIGTNAILASLL